MNTEDLKLLSKVISTLDGVYVKGEENYDRLLASITAIKTIISRESPNSENTTKKVVK